MNIKAFDQASKGTGGILQAIADRLKVNRTTVHRYIERTPKAREIIKREQEAVCDMAEGALFSKIKEKEAWATKFFLRTKGRHRDYIEKQEVEHSGGIASYNIVIEEEKSNGEISERVKRD